MARSAFRTARKPSELPAAFSERQRRRTPALIAELHSPDGETVGWQMRPRYPRKNRNGKTAKWMSPPADAARIILGVYPGMVHEVREGSEPLWIVEGATRAAALAAFGIPAVAIPGVWNWQRGSEPLRCWEYVFLRGRLVLVAFDADARTNENVQKALALLVALLEARGARVLVVSVPEVRGDEHAGLDDALAHGYRPETLAQQAAPFAPVSVGRERLKRSDQLRLAIGRLRQGVEDLETRKLRECSALAVARYMVEVAATTHGKPGERGVKVRPSIRQIAAGVRIAVGTVFNALEHLKNIGFLESVDEPRGRHEAASYLLLYPCGGGSEVREHIGEQRGAGKERQGRREEGRTSLYERESSFGVQVTRGGGDRSKNLPALRNPKLVHTWARKDGRRVVVDSHYFFRYGKKREAIICYVLELGGADEAEIHEKFGSKSSRLRDFRRIWIKPMVDDGVFVVDGGRILPAPDWPDALERVRERTDEEQDNRLQDQKYSKQRKAYRQAKDNPTDPTPKLSGPERAAEIVAASEKRAHASRVEEQRRKVGMTPEVFLADALRDASGFGWRELRALWTAKGGKSEDLRRAVRGPYRFRRNGDGPLYIERREAGIAARPEPERGPASVAVLRETPKVNGVYEHGPLCDCEWCAIPLQPKYAKAWSGA